MPFLIRFVPWMLVLGSVPLLAEPQATLLPREHAIMHPDLATRMRWLQEHRNLPKAPLDADIERRLQAGASASSSAFSLLPYLSYVPGQRNQGNCGDCWVWASTGMTEIALSAQYGVKDRLSIQYFNSCWSYNQPCCGGNLSDFTQWYNAQKILVPWSNTGGAYKDGSAPSCPPTVGCGTVSVSPHYDFQVMTPQSISTYGAGQAAAIANIKNVLNQNKAVGFSFYTSFGDSGGFYDYWEYKSETDQWVNAFCGQTWKESTWGGHMVVIVGYDESDSDPAKHSWIVLNSWGAGGSRPNGLFRMPMALDYDCYYVESSYHMPSYYFESLDLQCLSQVPGITVQPSPQTVAVGQGAAFTVVASGASPLSYQWRRNGTEISGNPSALTATYALTAAALADAGSYDVVVSNALGKATSNAVALTVNPAVAPSITAQPQPVTVTAGQSAAFSVAASGTTPLSYQWRKDLAAIAGAPSAATYGIAAATAADAGSYDVVVTNAAGSATSNSAVLTVNALVAPSITGQPQNQSVLVGQSAAFDVAATGTAPIAYQWWKNGVAIGGATASHFAIAASALLDAGSYDVVVSNGAGSVTSALATLTVTPQAVAPSITAQPQDLTVKAGQSASFSVQATGTAPLSYAWRKGTAPIAGATAATFTIPAAAAGDAGQYSVVVSNDKGSATSAVANLTVLVAPSITAQPVAQSVDAGKTATFSVVASGTPPFTYQWRKGAAPLVGAVASSLSLQNVGSQDAGSYDVIVSNVAGSTASSAATLTVNPVVLLTPTAVSLFTGDACTFTAQVLGSANQGVGWSASAGSISGGAFTAPATAGSVMVTASSLADATRSASATVTVHGTDFDGNGAVTPMLLGFAAAFGSSSPADLAVYDFNGDGAIDDADLQMLFRKMGW